MPNWALLSPDDEEDGEGSTEPETEEPAIAGEEAFRRRAAQIYASYRAKQGKGFHWLSPHLFTPKLKEHLLSDARHAPKGPGGCGNVVSDA